MNQTNQITPLELLNIYYSGGKSSGNKQNKLWKKMNALLSWDNILNRDYQTDLCPLLYFITNKALPQNYNLPSNKMISNSILSQLKEHYNRSLTRNMILLEELKRVVQKLKENDIKIIILKGAYLAENVYENIACRPMRDLDILVRNEDLEKCNQILPNMGYRNIPENSRIKMLHNGFFKKVGREQVNIEIHHRLVKEVFMTNFDLEGIWANDCLPIEYNLVYLSWHAIRHGAVRLSWLCDIAEIIKNNKEPINWNVMREKSLNFNVEKQFILIEHLSNLLIMPLLRKKENNVISYPVRCVSEALFLKIQNKVKNREDDKKLRHLLGMCMMKTKDLKIYIPQYLRYRFTN